MSIGSVVSFFVRSFICFFVCGFIEWGFVLSYLLCVRFSLFFVSVYSSEFMFLMC